MSDEYQLRKDIDRFNIFLDRVSEDLRTSFNVDITELGSLIENIDKTHYDTSQTYSKAEVYSKSESYNKDEVFTKSEVLDLIHPIGSIYMSVNDVNPSVIFGGAWSKIEGQFLLASSDDYPLQVEVDGDLVENTGGEATHTLTTDEMPSHNHTQSQHRHSMSGVNWSDGTGSSKAVIHTNDRKTVAKYTDYQTPSINNTGGGQAHNNMPPYLVVNVWKRIE